MKIRRWTLLLGWLRRFWQSRLGKITVGVVAVVLLLDVVFPIKADVSYSTIVTAADGSVLHTYLSRDDKWRLYVQLAEITPALRKALIFKEDRFFYYHPGINPVALVWAAVRNLLKGRRTSGASTITMQVVRLLHPRERTYGSKIVELLRALQLEWHYSKDEILQLYLNLIPYGGNVEGLKSASLLYFGKGPQLLSLAEITTLAIIPNRPSSLRLGRNNGQIMQARNGWLRRFASATVFPQPVIADALTEPLTAYRQAAPQLAPHLCGRLRREFPDQPIITSTLRPAVQQAAERLVQNYVNRVRLLGIQNAAVLVINNQTRAVEGYVGSADFSNTFDGGQVDGVRAVRSPGSALKPLLYALAFDAGLITPKSKLNDVPTNFGGYEPANYDQRFNGPVTAEFALANSLNIPAVKLLRDLGTSVMVEKLRQAGFTTIAKQRADLGLSLILGGCGVTLEEMTRLYVALANGGIPKNLSFKPRPMGAAPSSLLPMLVSPEAAFLVTNILTQLTRPDLPNNFDNSYHLPRIAWKTGTSYGRRDAWSLGYNRHYTIGVWVGNFSGAGVPELSGANTATPLLFSLFNALDYDSPTGWFRPPAGLGSRQICPESGDLPNDFCVGRAIDYHIMGVSRTLRCQHLKPVWTDSLERVAYCLTCKPNAAIERLYPNLAPDVMAYYAIKRLPYRRIPTHNPACERVFEQGVPQITSPTANSTYYINAKHPAQLALTCQAENDVRMVYWYLNDKLLRQSLPGEAVFFQPRPGRLKITCADDRGRHSELVVAVVPE